MFFFDELDKARVFLSRDELPDNLSWIEIVFYG